MLNEHSNIDAVQELCLYTVHFSSTITVYPKGIKENVQLHEINE